MSNYNISKNFILPEFISQEQWEKHGMKMQWAIDERIVQSVQALRDNLNVPLTINNWFWGGQRNESGFRVKGMKNYRPRSQHSYGRAVDVISSIPANEMRNHIFSNREKYPFITAIELDVGWLHIDCRFTNTNNIMTFRP